MNPDQFDYIFDICFKDWISWLQAFN